MGCADSRKMLTNETKKDDKYIQNNLLKKNETEMIMIMIAMSL